jgi:DNA-binding Lrp family transcriptional regulator
MTKALVLMTLEPDTGIDPIETIRGLQGVLESEMLYGPYDAYALINAQDSEKLREIIIQEIRDIDGVQSTLTCFVI